MKKQLTSLEMVQRRNKLKGKKWLSDNAKNAVKARKWRPIKNKKLSPEMELA